MENTIEKKLIEQVENIIKQSFDVVDAQSNNVLELLEPTDQVIENNIMLSIFLLQWNDIVLQNEGKPSCKRILNNKKIEEKPVYSSVFDKVVDENEFRWLFSETTPSTKLKPTKYPKYPTTSIVENEIEKLVGEIKEGVKLKLEQDSEKKVIPTTEEEELKAAEKVFYNRTFENYTIIPTTDEPSIELDKQQW